MQLIPPSVRRLSLLVATLALLTACAGETEAATTSADNAETSTTGPESTTSTSATENDVQSEIDWFVSVLNGEDLTAAQYEEKFSDTFREQVPFQEGFQPVLDQFRPAGPFKVVERSGEGSQGEAVIEAADGTQARILAELDEDGRFSGLLIQPTETPTLDDPPESIEEANQRLAELGTLGMVTAEIADGQCVPGQVVSPGDPVPLGSVAKLYVLAALGEAIESGEVAWDDQVEIRDELKSIPSGILQDRPAGEMVTVREMAELMISISDNTATDHLIDLLGRQTVESVMAEYGHTAPGLNIPFLNTRELTALKIGPASGLSDQWVEGDEQARRDIIEQISYITPADLPLQEWTEPIEPTTVEWFASPDDLCSLAAALIDLARSHPEISEILGMNPGVPAEPGPWDRVWFKGGSEPGLLAVWWVTESQGRIVVTAGSVVNEETTFDTDEAVLLFAAARDLLLP